MSYAINFYEKDTDNERCSADHAADHAYHQCGLCEVRRPNIPRQQRLYPAVKCANSESHERTYEVNYLDIVLLKQIIHITS